MSQTHNTNTKGKQVAVVIGATSKWQSDGRNTLLAHGRTVDDSNLPVGVRWGVGGAIAQKFAQEGFFVVLTTRTAANAAPLAEAIRAQGGDCTIVELDLVSQDFISAAFATIRRDAGDPEVLVYNAGYLEGRDLPPEKELLEHIPVEMFDTAQHIASRGPFLVAKEVLPAMRKKGEGSFFFSNNSSSLRGKKRMTGQSLYYPRVMMRTLAQVLTEEYSEHGVHVANVVIDGTIDLPGTRAMPQGSEPTRSRDQSSEDRRGVLLPAHPGPVMLDPRTSAHAISDQTELLTPRHGVPIVLYQAAKVLTHSMDTAAFRHPRESGTQRWVPAVAGMIGRVRTSPLGIGLGLSCHCERSEAIPIPLPTAMEIARFHPGRITRRRVCNSQ